MQAVNLLPEYARPGRRWAGGRQRAVVPADPADRRHRRDRAGTDLRPVLLPRADARQRQEERARNGAGASRRPVGTRRADQAGPGGESGAARVHAVRDRDRVHWDAVLGDLGRVLPTGRIARRASDGRGADAVAGAAAGWFDVHIAGQTSSHVRVATDPRSARPVAVAVRYRAAVDDAAGDAVTFTITATYVGGGGS